MRVTKVCMAVIIVVVVMLLFPTSCSKTGYTIIQTTADSASQIIMATDELDVSYEFDQAINEALLATTVSKIASGDTVSGTGAVLYNTIANVIIDTSHITDSALIRLTYYGKNADQTKGRSGDVTLQFARDNNGKIIQWKTPGAAINITFTQYEVVVLATNKSLWLNGTATITNLRGGLLKTASNVALATGDSLQDKVNANIVFTYNDNTNVIQTWTWNINQLRMFNVQNALLTSTIRGDTVMSNTNGISTWGTTRFGYAFYTQVITPVVQTISPLYLLSNPLSGQKAIHGIPEPLTIYYGVDNLGNQVLTGAPYGYKMMWIHNGGQATCVVSY
jgi:hypothetical protein